MAFEARSLDDYIDVAQRIADFRERYPEGTLQPADPAKPWEQAVVTGYTKDGKQFAATMIVYTAAAYRTPDDPRPGIGIAWETFPGRTPYTLGSELMNAETSAWGRAIIAVGASDSKRGIASREEVRNRQAERSDGLPTNADGSLSRSRTSDAEKEQAGVMTSAQQKEHTALRREPRAQVVRIRPGDCPACGLVLPEHDPECPEAAWNDPGRLPESWQPAEPLTPLSAGTISREQSKSMHAQFAAVGIKDREARLAWTRRALKLDKLGSSSELSRKQAGDLLAALAKASSGEQAT